MTPFLSTFKKTGRAAVVALALGAAALTAAPVQAQSGPSFNFNLDLGTGSMEFGPRHGGPGDFDRCLTNRQIRRGLADYGFRDVDIRRELGRNRVEAVGRYGRSWYSMRVNRCSGRVDRVERLRLRGGPGGPGFGLQFEFGN